MNQAGLGSTGRVGFPAARESSTPARRRWLEGLDLLSGIGALALLASFTVLTLEGIPGQARPLGRLVPIMLAIISLARGATFGAQTRFALKAFSIVFFLGALTAVSSGSDVQSGRLLVFAIEMAAAVGAVHLLEVGRSPARTLLVVVTAVSAATSVLFILGAGLDANYVAVGRVSSIAATFLLAKLVMERRGHSKRQLLGYLLLLLLILAGAVLSGSRSVLLLPPVVLLVIAAFRGQAQLRRAALWVLVFSLGTQLGVLVAQQSFGTIGAARQLSLLEIGSLGSDASFLGRLNGAWYSAAVSAIEQPLGRGYGTVLVGDDGVERYAHNLPLELGVYFGIAGVMLGLAILRRLWVGVRATVIDTPARAAAMLVILFLTLITGDAVMLRYVFLGLVLSIGAVQRAEPRMVGAGP